MKTRTLKSAWQRLSMSLALVMLTATAAWAQSAIGNIKYNSTGGYYEIGSTTDLNDLAVYVNGSGTYSTDVDETTGHDCKGLIFKVIGDINFSNGTRWNDDTSTEKNYTPIGAVIGNAKEFKGEFDGQGYTIRGIRMYKNGQYDYGYLGIFGKTGNSANIHDIRLADTRITGKSCIGGIVGYNAGTITNCHVAADVAIHVTQNDVSCHGGIVGLNSSGAISKCISSVTLTMAHNLTGCRTFGGIVGSLSGGTVSSSFAIGAAIPAVNGYGAICGRKDGGDTEYNYYYDCTVDGTAVTSGVGVGRLDDSSFDSTYHDGAVPMSGIAPGAWSETEPNVFTIHSADGWDVFCNIIAGGYNLSKKTVKLGTDITVTRMAGVDYKDFCGTFDGNGKTLTLDYTSTINCTAPFCQVKDGCVIENLHVDGTIASTQQYTAGIIGAQYGNVTIRNCRSSVNIQSTMSYHWYVQGYGKHGGFVGKVNDNTTTNLTIEGCVFDGKIVSNGETPTIHCSGFVGEKGSNASITITNSLYTPQADANAVSSGATFVEYWDGTPTNSYYTQTLGEAQGKAVHTVTAGEHVTTCDVALSGAETEYTVSDITAYANGGLKRGSTLYYGNGDQLSLTLANDASTDEQGYTIGYIVTGGAILSGMTLTMADEDVTISAGLVPIDWATQSSGDVAHPYMIYNKDQLLLLAHRVNGTNGETENTYLGRYFKLGADIKFSHPASEGDDYDENFESIGGKNNAGDPSFKGDFDGDGHIISGIRIRKTGTGSSYNFQGLFGRTGYGANIHNVHLTDARIKGYYYVGGIVGYKDYGTVSNTIVTNSEINAASPYYCGAICGEQHNDPILYNYYYGCTINGTAVTSGKGTGDDGDITEDNGAVPARRVIFGNCVTATPAIDSDGTNGFLFDGDDDGTPENYYRDGIELTLAITGDVPAGNVFSGFTINGEAISGDTFTVNADARVVATFFKSGDANGDGYVTLADAVAVVNYILGNPSENFNASNADVDGNGSITITDAVSIVNMVLPQ